MDPLNYNLECTLALPTYHSPFLYRPLLSVILYNISTLHLAEISPYPTLYSPRPKVLSVGLYNHYKRITVNSGFNKATKGISGVSKMDKTNVLLLGPTGMLLL